MTRDRQVLIPPHVAQGDLRGAGSGLPVRQTHGEAMGTTWRLRFQAESSVSTDTVHRAVDSAIALVVREMSHWDPASHLGRFNRAAPGTWQQLPENFFHVLQRAVEIADRSEGGYDPTLGRLVDLHGFGPPGPVGSPPDQEEIHDARRTSGFRRLVLDPPSRSALQPGGVQLDLSSIAKGHAVDLASRALLDHGVSDFVLEIGGEVRGHGCKPDGQPWWVEIETPPDLPETIIALCGLSLATSGITYRKSGNASHLIDPATGAPTINAVLSVSVVAPACIEADAWATALHLAGSERGPALAEKHGLAALFIIRTADGHRQVLSPACQSLLD